MVINGNDMITREMIRYIMIMMMNILIIILMKLQKMIMISIIMITMSSNISCQIISDHTDDILSYHINITPDYYISSRENDVTWTSWSLRSLATWLYVEQPVQSTTNKISLVLLRPSTSHYSSLLINGQQSVLRIRGRQIRPITRSGDPTWPRSRPMDDPTLDKWEHY